MTRFQHVVLWVIWEPFHIQLKFRYMALTDHIYYFDYLFYLMTSLYVERYKLSGWDLS
jgi:hypothetical protein